MKNLKRLGVSVTLMFVLAVAAFAGESSPLCAPPEPGQTNTPPCAEALTTAAVSVTQGETNAPPASNARDPYSVAKVAIDLLQSVLLLF